MANTTYTVEFDRSLWESTNSKAFYNQYDDTNRVNLTVSVNNPDQLTGYLHGWGAAPSTAYSEFDATIECWGLKPNTKHFFYFQHHLPFIDGTNAIDQSKRFTGVRRIRPKNGQWGDPLISDENGKLTFEFVTNSRFDNKTGYMTPGNSGATYGTSELYPDYTYMGAKITAVSGDTSILANQSDVNDINWHRGGGFLPKRYLTWLLSNVDNTNNQIAGFQDAYVKHVLGESLGVAKFGIKSLDLTGSELLGDSVCIGALAPYDNEKMKAAAAASPGGSNGTAPPGGGSGSGGGTIQAEFGQTFIIERSSVQQSEKVFLTSIDLFLQNKPIAGKTLSGIVKPGITVYVAPVSADKIDTSALAMFSPARVEFDNVSTSNNAATATKFTFKRPIPIKTNEMYAFVVKIDGNDPGYGFWRNKTGEYLLGTTNPTTVDSGRAVGSFFKLTNGSDITPSNDVDLKYAVRVAKFSGSSLTLKVNGVPMEFFTYAANTAQGVGFIEGEEVYQNTAYATGNLTFTSGNAVISGTSTLFTDNLLKAGDKIIITNDRTPGNTYVRTIASVASNTQLTLTEAIPATSNSSVVYRYMKTPIGRVYFFNNVAGRLNLIHSTANTSTYFGVGNTVVGTISDSKIVISAIENFDVHEVENASVIHTEIGTTAKTYFDFANTSYNGDLANLFEAPVNKIISMKYPGIYASRSNEVVNTTNLFNSNSSFYGTIEFTTSNPYITPHIPDEILHMFCYNFAVNSDASAETGQLGGNAISRYISKKVTLNPSFVAEDIRIYAAAFKPANTDIKVYAKIQATADSASFEECYWTELELATSTAGSNGVILSSALGNQDVVQLEYRIPKNPSSTSVNSTATILTGNTFIATSTNLTTGNTVVAGDLLKFTSPLFEDNFFVVAVESANSTGVVVHKSTTNSSLLGTGFVVSKVNDKHGAFINNQNNNICRYHDNNMAVHDGYNIFAIKVVLLADNPTQIPYVYNLKALAVSA